MADAEAGADAPHGHSAAVTDTNGKAELKVKLKVSMPLVANGGDKAATNAATTAQPLLIGAHGGAALKELLSTAPNPEVAIRDFQHAHGVPWPLPPRKKPRRDATTAATKSAGVAPSMQLLDMLRVPRSSVYASLLDQLLKEMLLRIQELSQPELQKLLEATFPYIEFRELRAIPIAILARQDDTPEAYLRELTENRRILQELPVHVRRKIMHVDKTELHIFVEQCTHEYVQEHMAWYREHDQRHVLRHGSGTGANTSTSTTTGASGNSSNSANNASDLWNATSHTASPSTRSRKNQFLPEDRRRQSAALHKLVEMIGDSEALYLSTIEILKEYVVAANIPGSAAVHPKDYVDYVSFLGALRCDLANIQRDRTTSLLRTDPMHKFIWFLDRATKSQHALDAAQLYELLAFIKRLRVGDLPLNKKFKKKVGVNGVQGSEIQDEEENFEIVLGPPPVTELLNVLDKIAKVDNRLIFAEPVPDDVPKYREIIKEPMDLSTMRKKAKRGKYKTLEMFTEDFNLMIRNCMAFNPDTTIFYKDAKRVGKRGNEIIEKNAVTLRGEPQRIRAKKRKKSGPGEVFSMLTSTGAATIKDFGDVDQCGMVPEGMCEEMLADVAMVLSEPLIKQMLCEALMRNLLSCWQRKELPTDNLICRGLIQLLQVGNPSSVRRMLRKKDFVLRAPQVVTMRVVLPLLLRVMVTFKVYSSLSLSIPRDPKVKEELLEATLWDNMLRASSAIRTMTKSFVMQCFSDSQVEIGAQLLQYLVVAEEDLLLRDRVFLHAMGDVVLAHVAQAEHTSANSDKVSERLRTSTVWKAVLDDFFVAWLAKKTRAMKADRGSVLIMEDPNDAVDEGDDNGSATILPQQPRIRSFAVSIFHEKVAMILATVFAPLKEGDTVMTETDAIIYLKRTLGVLMASCNSLEEFDVLYASQAFQVCREYYERVLTKFPSARPKLLEVAVITPKEESSSTMPIEEGEETEAKAGTKVEEAVTETKTEVEKGEGQPENISTDNE
ncbi:TPA: hypothetical protein N0F65_000210 [Lagenidium giganteum]|uniref:Bromo domain-containing protein n=1 Tax=Lagenidium giganteum TaxID=4803 RepID=A0AAV2YE27_9STRA|nr:TPA: hypothetical protein N0F65_000210 [Lagenidium giganteum]